VGLYKKNLQGQKKLGLHFLLKKKKKIIIIFKGESRRGVMAPPPPNLGICRLPLICLGESFINSPPLVNQKSFNFWVLNNSTKDINVLILLLFISKFSKLTLVTQTKCTHQAIILEEKQESINHTT